MQKQQQVVDNRYALTSPGILFGNPFAWSRFITDIKKKKFKSTLQERDFEEDDD